MDKAERDRAIMMINVHIEDGKQLIRDKRVLIDILEKEANKLSGVFHLPWNTDARTRRLESVYCELDRADADMATQRAKNSKLRDLRNSIQQETLTAPAPMLLLSHGQEIVASHSA